MKRTATPKIPSPLSHYTALREKLDQIIGLSYSAYVLITDNNKLPYTN